MSDQKTRLPVRQIHTRAVSPDDDELTFTPTGKIGTRADSLDIHAQDCAILDSNGNKITPANPLPVVQMASTPGDGVVEFEELIDIPKDATDVFTYTVPVGKLFNLSQVLVTSSGKIRAEVKWGVVASEVVKAMLFNSTANPDARLDVVTETEIPAASVVVVTVRNDDSQAASAYVTIQGVNITNP